MSVKIWYSSLGWVRKYHLRIVEIFPSDWRKVYTTTWRNRRRYVIGDYVQKTYTGLTREDAILLKQARRDKVVIPF